MKITYFINQYPLVSHSFIRREIMSLERQGIEIQRLSLRGWDYETVNEEDRVEKAITTYILKKGVLPLLYSTLKVIISRPLRFFSTLRLILMVNKASDRSFPFHIISLAEACHILPLMRQFGSQHIHAHFGTNSTEVIMLANSLGGPGYSFTVHGPEEFDKPKAINLSEKIQRSKFVVAISSFGRSQLYRWIDKSQWPKVKVVHCGLEKTFYNITSTSVPIHPQLVCVGRLCEQKGQLLLIEACKKLKKKLIDFKLILAGDGELRNDIETLIKRYNLEENIKITGWISSDNVRDELLSSKGMILPSFAEGLPVVIMEAMFLRRPVLTTYIAGIPELIENGKSGFLFPSGDVDAIANAMEDILKTPQADLEKMVSIGFNKVQKRHDIDTEATKLVSLFKANL